MNKVIVITGASSGMGKAFALALLKQGHIVYGLARRVEKMDALVQAGGKANHLGTRASRRIDQQCRLCGVWYGRGSANISSQATI